MYLFGDSICLLRLALCLVLFGWWMLVLTWVACCAAGVCVLAFCVTTDIVVNLWALS